VSTLGPASLAQQFVVTAGAAAAPEGWPTERIGDWQLARHPSLPATPLVLEDGRAAGWLIGYPISAEGILLDGRTALRVPAGDAAPGAIERFLDRFGGRFAAALVGLPEPRIYLDPAGSLAAVYCPHQRRVASTPALIPPDDATSTRSELVRALGIPYSQAMYPFDLTSRRAVHRLLPSHFLDLESWRAVRHWPTRPLADEGSLEEAAAEIAEIVKRQVAAVAKHGPTYIRLTAGADSRVLLACARSVLDRIELFTVPIEGPTGGLDADVARRINRLVRRPHLVATRTPATQADLDEYRFRIADGTGEPRGWQSCTMFKQARPTHAQLDGSVGGLERPRFFLASERADPERLLELCQAPLVEETLDAARRWLAGLPTRDPFQILDLFKLEQRSGGWAALLPYAEARDPGFVLYPMCHRRVIERMLTIPRRARLEGSAERTLMRAIVAREWPELLAWPFNEPVGWLRVPHYLRQTRLRIQRAWRDPRGAARRLGRRLQGRRG